MYGAAGSVWTIRLAPALHVRNFLFFPVVGLVLDP